MSSVTLRNVVKDFGAVKIIKGVNVEIDDGEFVVLIGPSGCGKSTLLRMIAGLEEISSGDVVIGGKVVNALASKDRDIAMVFQSYALYPHLTVRDNMGFSLSLAKRPKAEIAARVDQAAAVLGLGQLLDRFPKQLSGGQRQRVAMGRAIVRDPQVFLFDEPLSNLDAKLRVQMRVEIKALHQRLKTTTIYVTHDQIEAMTMADKIVVLRDGMVEQIGAPLELFDRPENVFVAQFLGSPAMNIFDGEAAPGGVRFGEGILPLPGQIEPGRRVKYGIRPEHLDLAADGLPVDVAVVESTGTDTMVFGRVGDAEIVANIRDRADIRAGQRIHLRPQLGKVHLFDAQSERRISLA